MPMSTKGKRNKAKGKGTVRFFLFPFAFFLLETDGCYNKQRACLTGVTKGGDLVSTG